jgi:hypothetical protein
MISKDFHVFLMQFSEKIQSVRRAESFTSYDLEQLDAAIEGMLEQAQRVYGNEMHELLQDHDVDPTLLEMKATVEAHLPNIFDFRVDHEKDQMILNFQGRDYRPGLLDIPTAIQLYFKVTPHLMEYHFVTAYLARTDHYDIIQIYHFLRGRLN